MKCSLCSSIGHNKRTCSHRGKNVSDIPSPIEIRIAESLSSSLDDKISLRKCSLCGSIGHNKRTCSIKESQACLDIKSIFDKTMEKLKPSKRVITCSLCKGKGHNSRTCSLKCRPCSTTPGNDQYPSVVESPIGQRKTEGITFANGETISIDLGILS